MKWWKAARFGMFIHFGVYSTIGRHEWVMEDEMRVFLWQSMLRMPAASILDPASRAPGLSSPDKLE